MRQIQATPSSNQRRAAYKAHLTMCQGQLKTARSVKSRSALRAKIVAYSALVDASTPKGRKAA
jgi:hypothetical protein